MSLMYIFEPSICRTLPHSWHVTPKPVWFLTSTWGTICCVRRGCCGPRSLTKGPAPKFGLGLFASCTRHCWLRVLAASSIGLWGDVDALATFKDIYFYQRIVAWSWCFSVALLLLILDRCRDSVKILCFGPKSKSPFDQGYPWRLLWPSGWNCLLQTAEIYTAFEASVPCETNGELQLPQDLVKNKGTSYC